MEQELNDAILVLDDEPLILSFLKSVLESGGHKVIQARSGYAASIQMARQPISTLIADVFLPDCDGREFAQNFLESNPAGRVLLMTGFAEEELVLPHPLRGRVHLLEKPFSSGQLLELLTPPPEPAEPLFPLAASRAAA